MKTLEQLYNWFFLDTTCANAKITNCDKFLRVAPLKKIDNYTEIQIEENNFAFAEKNGNWEIEYFHGLKRFLRIEKNKLPQIFIFDNHNHAPVFWYYYIKKSNTNSQTLIHIDQHSDCWENKGILELRNNEYDLEKVFHFYNEKCNVGNFIPPSLQSWIICDQIQIRSITALQNLEIEKNQKFILDIDLDFCLKWIDRKQIDKESVKLLKEKFDEISELASCITIATSPYFLNQEIAKKIIEELLNK